MGKNTLDLNRKLKKYHQYVKVLRRGLQVKINKLNSKSSDFALGTYHVKGSNQYSLIINIDLPKKADGLLVNFWGLDSNKNVSFLNANLLTRDRHDTKIKFWTYPKTKFLFITFTLEFENTKEECQYSINYIFLESKTPIPRGIDTPTIPSSMVPNLDINCTPELILNIDLDNLWRDLKQVNIKLFQSVIFNYLLNLEDEKYLEILKKNINLCSIRWSPNLDYQDNCNQLKELKSEIEIDHQKIKEYLVKIDNISHHKYSLEHSLELNDHTPYDQKEKYDNQINILNKIREELYLKLNQIEKLIETNQSDQIPVNDRQKMGDILEYYYLRVKVDIKNIKNQIILVEEEFQKFEKNILLPQNNAINKEQSNLDSILVDYRQVKKECQELKSSLDNKIIKFMSLWYQSLVSNSFS